MALAELYAGSAAIGATEYSAPNASTTPASITTDGVIQVFLDTSDMVIGDSLRIRIKEKCQSSSTQRVIYEAILTGTMADTWVSPSLVMLHGWDVTLQAITGTITVEWSIRSVA
jgi:hypothetical protein